MRKKRLRVRIDGVWYRVSHGKLRKISGLSHKRHAANSQVSAEFFSSKSHSSMGLAFKDLRSNKAAKGSRFLRDHLNPDEADEGLRGDRPQAEPFPTLGHAEHAYESSDDSCVSTATSAKKSLVIKLRLTQ